MTIPCPSTRTDAKTCPPDCALCRGLNVVVIVTAVELIAELHSRQRNVIHVPELLGILGQMVQKQKK